MEQRRFLLNVLRMVISTKTVDRPILFPESTPINPIPRQGLNRTREQDASRAEDNASSSGKWLNELWIGKRRSNSSLNQSRPEFCEPFCLAHKDNFKDFARLLEDSPLLLVLLGVLDADAFFEAHCKILTIPDKNVICFDLSGV